MMDEDTISSIADRSQEILPTNSFENTQRARSSRPVSFTGARFLVLSAQHAYIECRFLNSDESYTDCAQHSFPINMETQKQESAVSDAVRKHKEFLFPAVATYYQEPIALVRGEGEYVWDDQGNKYLDCFGGVLTVSVGHANPKINAAVNAQNDKIQHTSTLYANKPQSDLAEKLYQITPGELKKSFFTNSGTEADDTAILAAKIATGRNEIVVLRHSYSGRSATSLSAVGHSTCRPLPPQVA